VTGDEREQCLRMIRVLSARWDDDHAAMWVRYLERYPYAVAAAAIDAMAESEEIASVAAFTRFARGGPAEVLVDGERMFLPGSGWVGPPPRRRALEAAGRDDAGAQVVHLEEARRRLEEARSRKLDDHEEHDP
jgi:hypothetical protein